MFTFLMPEKVINSIERIMRNFFFLGRQLSSKLNNLVKWELVTKSQGDGELGLDKLKIRNMALLAKWRWRFLDEPSSLWCKVVRSIHDSDTFIWHTSGKESSSLRSPWISISRQQRKVEILAVFKVGKGDRILFWLDPWMNSIALWIKFPRLYRIALPPKGSVTNYWDSSSSSWSIIFRCLLKEEEISDFQFLLESLDGRRPTNMDNKRSWSLEHHGEF